MRLMTDADVDAVLLIEQTVQPYPWSRGNFCDAMGSGYLCCVEEAAGEVRGYVVLMPGAGEAELLTIGVAPAYQRKGLARTMLSAMLQQAQDKDLFRVFLEVRASNRGAIALYRHAGFLEIGMRRGYYRNADGCEDALVMACDSPPVSSGEPPGEKLHG